MKVLASTSPARGHLFPMMPILLELHGRGRDVVYTPRRPCRTCARWACAREMAAAGGAPLAVDRLEELVTTLRPPIP